MGRFDLRLYRQKPKPSLASQSSASRIPDSLRQMGVRYPFFENWKITEARGFNKFDIERAGQTHKAVKCISQQPVTFSKGDTVIVGFWDHKRSRPFIWAAGQPADPVRVFADFVTLWPRQGVTAAYTGLLVGRDENDSARIPISGLGLTDPVVAEIVRSRYAQTILSRGEIMVFREDESEVTVDLADPIVALSLGAVSDEIVAITHGTTVTEILDCPGAYSRGLEDGQDYGYGPAGLFDQGAFDCSNGDGYAWDTFGYEATIRSFENTTEPGWGWSIPGTITFSAPSDADCYRDGFVEGAKTAYDQGSTEEGCGP